ncbi:MAG: hypothetical protein ABL967_20420, partial [Bryobacteraceae bacterium]
FYPAVKIQAEDDITASVVVPGGCVAAGVSPAVEPGFQPGGNTSFKAAGLKSSGTNPGGKMPPSTAGETPAATIPNSLKFVANCERRLFQRPDDAIHRGYDKQTEIDFARADNFFSNYEPLNPAAARALVEEAIGFNQFTEPMQSLIRSVAEDNSPSYFVSSANPRIVDGKPSKNPRYLQVRPDLLAPREVHLAEMATRLRRHVPPGSPVHNPVGAVLPGRRNNPPEPGIRSLAVFNPIHYFELPELFMEFICSMTGKSPSTTGAGSEGALTKGPFNALPPIIDLNNALVSFLLTGHNGFVTAAGCVGPKFRVDHDVSLLVPEVWCHMNPPERDPQFLIANHYLDKCEDFVHDGKKILASRLGYRINIRFVHSFFGRMFNHPHAVFTDTMLKPELQDMAVFVDGMNNIIATQKRVSKMYFDDGSIAQACPPLQALLHIMLHDQWQGKDLNHPDVRKLFTRENLLASDWYAARLKAKQSVDRTLWKRHVEYLDKFLKRASHADEAARLHIADRLTQARKNLAEVEGEDYWKTFSGTLGAEPIGSYR